MEKEIKYPSWDKIKLMDNEEQKNILADAKANFTGLRLQAYWGISAGTLYSLYAKHNLYEPKAPRIEIKKRSTNGFYSSISKVPPIEEILASEKSVRKGILMSAKNEYTVSALRKHWGLSQGKMYKIFKENDIIKKDQPIDDTQSIKSDIKPTTENPVTEKVNNDKVSELFGIIENLEAKINLMNSKKEEKSKGFKIEINDIYNKEDLENRILSLAGVTVEGKKYKVQMSIEEV